MTSSIDPSVPVAVSPTTQSVRTNFQHAYDEITALQALTSGSAPLASPQFTGDPRAPTPVAGDADTSLATTAFVAAATAAAVAPLLNNAGRNLLHNPLFRVAQRGAGPWTTNTYTLDRWVAGITLDATSFTQVSLNDATRTQIGDEAAAFGFQNVFTGNAGATAFNSLAQRIEGVRRVAGKTVTVSFWAAAASGTPKLGASIDQYFGSGGSPSANVAGVGQATPALSAAWARYSFTFVVPSASGKTLGTNNDDSTNLLIWYSSGTTNASRAGNIGVQSGTVIIWGVQLEIGSVVTPLEKPDPQPDLANCQRFYQIGTVSLYGYAPATANFGAAFPFATTMRAVPVVAIASPSLLNLPSLSLSATLYAIRVSGAATAASSTYFDGSYTASAEL